MGLASSQVRFAMLTSRQNDVESSLTRIAGQKLSLSRQSAEASSKYSDALNATKLVWSAGSGNMDVSYSLFNNEASSYMLSNSAGETVITSSQASKWGLTEGGVLPDRTTFISRATGSSVEDVQKILDTISTDETDNDTNLGKGTRYTAAYTDRDVFTTLFSLSSSEGWGTDSLTKQPFASATLPTESNVVAFCQYDVSNEQDTVSAAQVLMSLSSKVVSQTSEALISVLQSKFGSSWGDVSDEVQTAADAAKMATINYYQDQCTYNNIVNVEGESETDPQKLLNGTTNIGCADNGKNEFLVDLTEMSKVFLSYFDQYSQLYDTDKSNDDVALTFTTSQAQSLHSKDSNVTLYHLADRTSDDGDSAKAREEEYKNSSNYKESVVDRGLAWSDHASRVASISVRYGADITQGTGTKCVAGASENGLNSISVEYWSNFYDALESNSFTINDKVTDKEYLQQQLSYGSMVAKQSYGSDWYSMKVGAPSSPLSSVSDEDAIAQAEADYQAEKDKISYKESILDVEKSNLDSEREAVKTEKDSVQKIIDDNIQKFKLFQNG